MIFEWIYFSLAVTGACI